MKTEDYPAKFDKLKWLLIVLLLAAGIFINDYFYNPQTSSTPTLVLIGLLFLTVMMAFIFFQTQLGRRFFKFAGDARTELRKVSWPTRTETIQVTRMILVVIVVVALVLGVVDWLASHAIKWLMIG